MPNEVLCTLDLSKKKRAVAYKLETLDSPSTTQSVIKIFHAPEEKPLHEIQLAGTVKSMRWVKQGLFAVTTEGSSDILLYNDQRGELKKTLFIPAPAHPECSTLTISPSYLVSSTYEGSLETASRLPRTTHLHVYDTEKFSYKRIKINGVIISQSALAISNHLLYCEIAENLDNCLSQVDAYNLETGILLRKIGETQVVFSEDKPFLALLNNNEYLFRTHISPRSFATTCLLYQSSLSSPIVKSLFSVRIEHAQTSSFCALPQGGIAVYSHCSEMGLPIPIYHPLELKTPEIATSSKTPLKLKTPEDVTSFIAEKELPRLATDIGKTAQALRQLSLFPEPLAKLVTGYSLSSEAQEDRFVDDLVEGSWPKP